MHSAPIPGLAHLNPSSFALTRQEADHLKRSTSYRTVRLNIQTIDLNYPASSEAEGHEVSPLCYSPTIPTDLWLFTVCHLSYCRMCSKFALVIPP